LIQAQFWISLALTRPNKPINKGNKMKLMTKIVPLRSVGAFHRASRQSPRTSYQNVVSITATVLIQATSQTTGTNTTAAAPSKHSLTTQTLLGWLAQDEYAEGNYGSTIFQRAQNSWCRWPNNGPDFQVLDQRQCFIWWIVSDILDGISGDNDVYSGKQMTSTDYPSSTTEFERIHN